MKTNYNFSELGKVNSLFRGYFNVSISQFHDGLMSMISKRLTIDMFKFDDWLHKQHGDYESQGLSMSGIIYRKYGKEAKEFIESFL